MPANGETCTINTPTKIPIDVSLRLLKAEAVRYNAQPPDPKRRRIVNGILCVRDNRLSLIDIDEMCDEIGINRHIIRFTSTVRFEDPGPAVKTAEKLRTLLAEKLEGWTITISDGNISIESVLIKVEGDDDSTKNIYVSWTNQDEDLGSYILGLLQSMVQ